MNTQKRKDRVFFVDGNRSIREAVALALSREGYEVSTASTVKGALAVMRTRTVRIDVVISEVNFRGEMSGPSLFKALRKLDEGLKCIFVSGYHEDALRKMLDKDEAYAFLVKPFTTRELLAKVEEVAKREC